MGWTARVENVRGLRRALKRAVSCMGYSRYGLAIELGLDRIRLVSTNGAELSLCEVCCSHDGQWKNEDGRVEGACLQGKHVPIVYHAVLSDDQWIMLSREGDVLRMETSNGVRLKVEAADTDAFPYYRDMLRGEWIEMKIRKGPIYNSLYRLSRKRSSPEGGTEIKFSRHEAHLENIGDPEACRRLSLDEEAPPELIGESMVFDSRKLLASLEYAKADRLLGRVVWKLQQYSDDMWLSRFAGTEEHGLESFRVVASMRPRGRQGE